MGKTRGYLTTIGFIDGAGKVTLRLGYLFPTDDPTYADRLKQTQEPVTVSQLDANGGTILDYDIPAGDLHADPEGGEVYFFSGKVPLDDTTSLIQLSRQGKVFQSFDVPLNPPAIQLTWTPGASVTGPQTIGWTASHPDGKPMEFLVMYTLDGGTTYRQLSPSLTGSSYVLDFDRLPGGSSCQVVVLATDGVNTTPAGSVPFSAPIKPVQAMVLAPKDQAQVRGDRVTLQGQGYYLEEDQPELDALAWTSSVDGPLGTGRLIQPTLSPGTHTITLTAGTANRAGTASLTLNVS